jgi:hypothetical protein
MNDHHGISATQYAPKYEKLLNKITSKITDNVTIWRLWAGYWMWKQDYEKVSL